MTPQPDTRRLGWIGTGRMGYRLAERLLKAGNDVSVYNRTRSKAEPLADLGATIVDSPRDLGDRDIVFTMVAGPKDVLEVVGGDSGVLSGEGSPQVIVDSTTIHGEASRRLVAMAAERGTDVLAAPVSGNPSVVKSGKLTVVVSGPREAYDTALPYLSEFGRKVTWVGAGDEARLVKLCHNLHLGVVTQSLAEITMLAEAAGVKRSDFLEFFNESVMGSTFTRYKTPQFVNLDWDPTFTWHLLRKDFELGLKEGAVRDVPLPTAALVHQMVIDGIGRGYGDLDFGALLELEAGAAGRTLESEDLDVPDGLSGDGA
jgi:3-hydroxyisobutyrate dehydrogenase-like beta-hydroxyacid dehydrogenase